MRLSIQWTHERAGCGRPRPAAGAGLLLVGMLLVAGCSDRSASGKVPATVPAIPVTAAVAARHAVPVQVQAVGTVQAVASVTIKSQVDGQVLRVHFAEGETVRKGDLLFTLDPAPFEAALRQARASLGRDTAQVAQTTAAHAQAEAAEAQAEANLARDIAQLENGDAQERRYRALIDDGAVSTEQYDAVRTAARALEATVRADQAAVANAQAAIQAAQAAVANAEAAVEADRALVDTARIQLGYSEIRAPMDGRAGSLLVHPGSTVKARDDASAMVVLNQIQPIYLAFSVPQRYLADIERYQAAGTVRVEAIPPGADAAPIPGALTFVNNTVDPATASIQLKATFPNRDDRLWPGLFLNTVLTLTTEPDAVVIPAQAIQAGQGGPYVYLIGPDKRVTTRNVVVGRTVDGVTVVQAGLAAGERVVTDGQVRLAPGAQVEPRSATGALSAGRATG